MSPPVIHSAMKLRGEVFVKFSNAAVSVGDADYCEVDRAYIENALAPMFRGWLAGIKFTYDTRGRQCNHFSLLAAAKACEAYGAATERPTEGAPFGLMDYTRERDGVRHRLNLIRTQRGLEAWEPQTQQFIELTARECLTATIIFFP